MRKRPKTRTTQLLTMDELRARPCEVDGVPALFHRWIEEDRAILKCDAIGYRNEVIRETFALVEYRDGTIHKVKPELIRFIGKEGQHGT